MSAVVVILSILIILVALGLIVVVLMQEGNKQGLGAIGGGAETFFGKNKAKSYEGKLATLTKILIVAFIALALVMTIVVSANNPDTTVNMEDLPLLEGMEEFVETETSTDATTETGAETVEPVVDETVEGAAVETETAVEGEE